MTNEECKAQFNVLFSTGEWSVGLYLERGGDEWYVLHHHIDRGWIMSIYPFREICPSCRADIPTEIKTFARLMG